MILSREAGFTAVSVLLNSSMFETILAARTDAVRMPAMNSGI
jgi:hypothetical protein